MISFISQRPVTIISASDSDASIKDPSNLVLSFPISISSYSTLSPNTSGRFFIPAWAESLNALSPNDPVTNNATFTLSSEALLEPSFLEASPLPPQPASITVAIPIATKLHNHFLFIPLSPLCISLTYLNYLKFLNKFFYSLQAEMPL